ncbi:hypothetical protein EYS14_18555 [Alteromonadaceae bacterium M269]|nr:hypothetical protein EYS14_18555 [Alteromonadaceae bacterium M269]
MATPHGRIKLTWIDNILQLEGFGPFNEEGIVIALEDIQSKILHRPDSKKVWQRLDMLNYETIGSPKVMRVIGHSYLWSFSHGCNAIATVYSNVIQKAMLLDFKSETNTNMGLFEQKEDALEWLAAQ